MARKNKNCPHRRVCGNFCGNCEFSETFTRMQKHIDRLKRKLEKPVNVLVGGTPTQDVSCRATVFPEKPYEIGCEICAPLLVCPVGDRRKTRICDDGDSGITDMEFCRDANSTLISIFTEKRFHDGNYFGVGFDIFYCPFCGTQLKYEHPSRNQEVEANEKS